MFYVKDMAQFGLKSGGAQMNIGADLLKECTVIENTHMLVPSVSMTFVDDKKRAMTFGAFADGAPLEVTIGDGKGNANTYKFRSFSIDQGTANNAGSVISITGVADILPWFRKTVDKHYEGPASSVIQKIAQECGMTADVQGTSDAMTWLPDNRAMGQFCRKVIDHGWMGEGASPFMAVTSQNGQWQVRVKDIMKIQPQNKRLVSMGLNGRNDHMILEYKVNAKSGAMNSFVNYGDKTVQEMLSGDLAEFAKMTFAKGVSALGINSGIAGAIGAVRHTFAPPDVGNTHENYTKAFHNNRKARATYTTNVYVTLWELTKLRLLDDVEVILAMSDGTVDAAYSGRYKVSAISRHVSKGAFVEKLELTNQGVGVDVHGGGM